MSTSIRSDAVRRCRDAFEANGIPWDETLASLPVAKLQETADYWEDRFATKGVPAVSTRHYFPTGQIRDLLSNMASFPRTRGTGGITDRQRIRVRRRIHGHKNVESPCGDGGMIS